MTDFAPPEIKLPIIQPGIPFICRMCTHLANAFSKGIQDCGQYECGGPLTRGRSFPCYKGPLETVISKYCFYCGNPSELIFQVDDDRKLGFCKACEKKLLIENEQNME